MQINEKAILNLFIDASKLMSKEPDKCGNLVYTQKESGKSIIREPEVTHILAQLLSDRHIDFGVEVPTKKRYRIKGKIPDTASIDLSIFKVGKQINIEFKTKQPNVDEIEKDFKKLLGETTQGCAFFHILKNYNRGTFDSLIKKYKTAYDNLTTIENRQPKWFLLFIYVKEKQECYWQIFEDITNILNFNFVNLSKIKLRE